MIKKTQKTVWEVNGIEYPDDELAQVAALVPIIQEGLNVACNSGAAGPGDPAKAIADELLINADKVLVILNPNWRRANREGGAK
jgi:hypothetical protein